MTFKLKYKLSLLISILLLVSISASAYFLIEQKRREIKEDIWKNGVNFAELTTQPLMDSYELYFLSKSFLFFQRELNHIFSLNEDINRIRIANFSGEIIFDSKEELEKQKKVPAENTIKKMLEDIKPSVKTDLRTVYFKQDSEGKNIFVDAQEHAVESLSDKESVIEIIYPSNDNKSRVIYSVSYNFLAERTAKAMQTIIIMLIVVAIIGILVALIFANRLVTPIMILVKGVQKIAQGDLDTQVEVNTRDETKILANAFNQMAGDLKKSIEIKVAHERVEKELEIATKVQAEVLPSKAPEIEGLEIAISTTPASEVGGDCYDFIKLNDDNYLIYLGDATGHGIPASLVVSLTNASIYQSSLRLTDVKEILDYSNKVIKVKTRASMFITLVACHWDVKNKKLSFVQAGHDQMLIYRAKEKKVELLPKGGMALGMLPDISKITKSVDVDWEKGDSVYLYSDGIPEAWNEEKKQLGFEEYQAIVKKHGHLESAQAIHDEVLKEVKKFMGSHPAEDDISLMVVKKTS